MAPQAFFPMDDPPDLFGDASDPLDPVLPSLGAQFSSESPGDIATNEARHIFSQKPGSPDSWLRSIMDDTADQSAQFDTCTPTVGTGTTTQPHGSLSKSERDNGAVMNESDPILNQTQGSLSPGFVDYKDDPANSFGNDLLDEDFLKGLDVETLGLDFLSGDGMLLDFDDNQCSNNIREGDTRILVIPEPEDISQSGPTLDQAIEGTIASRLSRLSLKLQPRSPFAQESNPSSHGSNASSSPKISPSLRPQPSSELLDGLLLSSNPTSDALRHLVMSHHSSLGVPTPKLYSDLPTNVALKNRRALSRLGSVLAEVDRQFDQSSSGTDNTNSQAATLNKSQSCPLNSSFSKPLDTNALDLSNSGHTPQGNFDFVIQWLDSQSLIGPYRNSRHCWPCISSEVTSKSSYEADEDKDHHDPPTQTLTDKHISDLYYDAPMHNDENTAPQGSQNVDLSQIPHSYPYTRTLPSFASLAQYLPHPIGDRSESGSVTSLRSRNSSSASTGVPGSVSSQMSQGSYTSAVSHASWGSRKGRRKCKQRKRKSRNSSSLSDGRPPRKRVNATEIDLPEGCDSGRCDRPLTMPNQKSRFYCQWCWMSFNKPIDWKRHEESQHAPQTEWVCMMNGPLKDGDSGRYCVLCKKSEIVHNYFCEYRVSECIKKPERERCFARKDHLVQHLGHRMHRMRPRDMPQDLEKWQRSICPDQQLLWDCFMCDKKEMTWPERYSHFKSHTALSREKLKLCRCTLGHSARLKSLLDDIGQSHIYGKPCKLVWVTTLDRQDIIWHESELRVKFNITDNASSHLPDLPNTVLNTLGNVTFSCWARLFAFVINGAARVFWCGFCDEVIEDDDAQYNRGSYDCARLFHIDRHHTTTPGALTWKDIDPLRAAHMFLRVRDYVVSTLVLLYSQIPQDRYVNFAALWAGKVVFYNFQLAALTNPMLSVVSLLDETRDIIQNRISPSFDFPQHFYGCESD